MGVCAMRQSMSMASGPISSRCGRTGTLAGGARTTIFPLCAFVCSLKSFSVSSAASRLLPISPISRRRLATSACLRSKSPFHIECSPPLSVIFVRISSTWSTLSTKALRCLKSSARSSGVRSSGCFSRGGSGLFSWASMCRPTWIPSSRSSSSEYMSAICTASCRLWPASTSAAMARRRRAATEIATRRFWLFSSAWIARNALSFRSSIRLRARKSSASTCLLSS
mmetsp:Transcript_62076/g.196285  ORF Transcript_62076/g.196285 Transcript_62076/m.196285 type:complete len:225 (-) Transcript_62076:1736-2410(-)